MSLKIIVITLALSITGCSVHTTAVTKGPNNKTKKIPPGQAKKMKGDKSAKNYAPGHR